VGWVKLDYFLGWYWAAASTRKVKTIEAECRENENGILGSHSNGYEDKDIPKSSATS
jgi:hypothetical protein